MTIDELVREYMAGFFVGVSRSLSEDSEGPTNVDIWARGIEVGRSAYLAAEQAARAQLEALRTTAIPATFTHAEAHSICELLTEADEESERGMPSGLDPEVREHVGRLMAKVWAANTERKPEPTRPPGECAACDGGSSPEAQRADLAAEIREDMAAETAPPVGRFWRVWDVLNYHGIAECNRAGVPSLLLDLRIVTTREEAMKMGADCGLPSWYDALPERFWRVVSCESYGFIGYRALAWSQSNTTINTNDCGPWHWAAADVPSNEFRVQAREAAEEDGRASGLNPWKGGK